MRNHIGNVRMGEFEDFGTDLIKTCGFVRI